MGSEASGPVVKVEKLSQRYGKAVALADVNLEIPANKMIGLIGPDGVGKSTLLGIIAGVLQDCLSAAGTGQESLSDAFVIRERGFFRAPLRPVARRTRAAHH